MQILFNTISISCACLLVLFGFIINNEVDARTLTRDAPPAAVHHNRHQHSAHGKKPKHSQSNDVVNVQNHARAVRAVLDYAQYKFEQSKRDDDTPMWSETITDPDEATADSTNDDAANVWTEEATGEVQYNLDVVQELNDNSNSQWTERKRRQLKQRQIKK